jgi:acetyl esterase/lipase
VQWLVEGGLCVVVLPPPPEPSVRAHPALKEALSWLREAKDQRFTADRPVLVGRGDAGRQLALLVNERPQAFRGLLLSSAPSDLGWAMGENTWIGPLQPGEGVRRAIGEDAAGRPEPLVAGSPALQRWPQLPPTLVLHAGRDPWVSPEHARRLQAVFNEQGRDSLLVELPWALPGFELASTGPSAWVLAPLVRAHARRWTATP